MFRYRADVLERLVGARCTADAPTPPELVRDYVRDLIQYESAGCASAICGSEFTKAGVRAEG